MAVSCAESGEELLYTVAGIDDCAAVGFRGVVGIVGCINATTGSAGIANDTVHVVPVIILNGSIGCHASVLELSR